MILIFDLWFATDACEELYIHIYIYIYIYIYYYYYYYLLLFTFVKHAAILF